MILVQNYQHPSVLLPSAHLVGNLETHDDTASSRASHYFPPFTTYSQTCYILFVSRAYSITGDRSEISSQLLHSYQQLTQLFLKRSTTTDYCLGRLLFGTGSTALVWARNTRQAIYDLVSYSLIHQRMHLTDTCY